MQKPTIIIILGPTATGKSNLAVKIAKKISGEIISADSRQVYKKLNIGTAKISKKEMKGISHHLLSIINPKNKFTVVEYKKLAEEKIREIIARGNIPIICGGTGFYIDAVAKGIIFPKVAPNKKLRKSLEKKSIIELFKILKSLDSRRAKNIDSKNKIRLIRAIEIAKTLGKVPELQYDTNSAEAEFVSSYKFIKIGLYLPADKLRKKIEKRVRKMFKDGLLNEIKKLKKIGISKKRLEEFGFEYNNPTIEKVINETIKYTKRQMTWFKRDKDITWVDASLPKKLFKQISKKINFKKLKKLHFNLFYTNLLLCHKKDL